MSHTDKTRPWWVQEKDPLNRRFRMVGHIRRAFDMKTGLYELYEWTWKPLFVKHKCWCCSQKYAFYFEDGRERMNWRHERQSLIKQWKTDLYYWQENDFYDHWAEDDLADCENHEGLRFIDFYGSYTVG